MSLICLIQVTKWSGNVGGLYKDLLGVVEGFEEGQDGPYYVESMSQQSLSYWQYKKNSLI